MTTLRADIKKWLEEAKRVNATHMIVVCDKFDWSDYPIFVMKGEDVRQVVAEYDNKNMQKVMEVYNLSMDIDKQLEQPMAFNY